MMRSATTRRSILREYPELRHGGWIELPIPEHIRTQFPSYGYIHSFHVDQYYSVQVYKKNTEWGTIVHLVIRHHDQTPIHSWTELQRIKNAVVGPDRVGIEVYPAECDLVDQANLYHLWVLPHGFRLPFGLQPDSGPGALYDDAAG